MSRINFFAGGELDRAARLRADPAWLADRRADPRRRYVAVWRGLCLVEGEDPPRAALLPPEALADIAPEVVPVALLGIADGAARFAVDLSFLGDDPVAGPLAGRGAFSDLRAVGGQMPAEEAQLLAQARGLTYWHERHRFCGVCGSPTEARDGGYARVCADAACAAHHFPRTDPAVIMLVRDGDRCLLGRQAVWPDGMYSALAGFVEPGESLEEAVAREVREETGIEVADVRYHSSQPWPFPSSLMLGFDAEAVTTDIDLDPNELEDARWFSRDELRSLPDGVRLPRPVSIARRLVEDWIAGGIV
jgi:NAD+ diphosphatase